MHPRDETIFALSSGRPPSAIAIVRVSGPQAGTVLTALAGKLPVPRMATRALIRDSNRQPIDDAVVLWFPGPASATGEDLAEFHVHGGRAVLAALFAALGAFDHVRAAEAGEFTRRAFENGKLDLTEAEGLDDLIHADTDRQRRQALRQLKGVLGDKARGWRAQIIEASALIEAGIDFSDEGLEESAPDRYQAFDHGFAFCIVDIAADSVPDLQARALEQGNQPTCECFAGRRRCTDDQPQDESGQYALLGIAPHPRQGLTSGRSRAKRALASSGFNG